MCVVDRGQDAIDSAMAALMQSREMGDGRTLNQEDAATYFAQGRHIDLERWELASDFTEMDAWLNSGAVEKRRKFFADHLLATMFRWRRWLDYKKDDPFWAPIRLRKRQIWENYRKEATLHDEDPGAW